MSMNQIGGKHFSAIAASSNPPFERDAPEALSFCAQVILACPSIQR